MFRNLAILALLVLCAVGWAARSEETTDALSLRALGEAAVRAVQTRSDLNFDVEFLPTEAGIVPEVISRADAARRELQRQLGEAFAVRVRIVLTPNKDSFVRLVGDWAENSSAVAAPRLQSMVINGDSMRTEPYNQLSAVLLHEMSHLYLGARVKRSVPRWLDEGIAQVVAGEGGGEDYSNLVWARWFGSLPPLGELEYSFPNGADRQRLAYLESAAIVRFVVQTENAGSLAAFMGSLTNEQTGTVAVERFWQPTTRDALMSKWRHSLGSGWQWMTVFLSSGLFWGITTALLVLAYVVIRLRRRKQHREWDEEEQIYAALDEEEERVWGEHDEEARSWNPEHDQEDELVFRDPYEQRGYEDWEDGGGRRRR